MNKQKELQFMIPDFEHLTQLWHNHVQFVAHLQRLPRRVHGECLAPVEERHGEPARQGATDGGSHLAVDSQQAPEQAASHLQGRI